MILMSCSSREKIYNTYFAARSFILIAFLDCEVQYNVVLCSSQSNSLRTILHMTDLKMKMKGTE